MLRPDCRAGCAIVAGRARKTSHSSRPPGPVRRSAPTIGAKRRTTARAATECDVLLARLATRQCGVVEPPAARRARVHAATRSRRRVEHGTADPHPPGRLRRRPRGPQRPRADDRRACSPPDPARSLSHRTAAALWKLIPSMPPFVEVTLDDRRPRQRDGLRIHHATQPRGHDGTTASRSPPRSGRSTTSDDRPRLVRGALPRPRRPRRGAARSRADPLRARAQAAPGDPRSRRPAAPARQPRAWAPTRSTSSGPSTSSSSRPTAGPGTVTAWRSSATARATPACRRGGYAVLRFTWRQVMHETLLVTVRIAQLLARTPHHALATPPAGG